MLDGISKVILGDKLENILGIISGSDNFYFTNNILDDNAGYVYGTAVVVLV